MKIRTKAYILFVIFITAVIALFCVFYFNSRQIAKVVESNNDVVNIGDAIAELRMQTFNYVLYRSENSKQQWLAAEELLIKLLSPEEHLKHKHSETEHALLDQMWLDASDLGDLFSQLTQKGISQELETQISSRIITKSSKVMLLTSQLFKFANKRIVDTQKTADYLRIFFLTLLLAATLSMIYSIFNSVLKPLANLHRGTEKIEQGDLDFKVGIKSKDEIGQLARSFDKMAESIKKSQARVSAFADITKKNLSSLIPVLQKISMGDFSENIAIPEKEDEFTELFVALNLMFDDLKELSADAEKQKQDLENANKAAQNVLEDLQAEKEKLAEITAKDEAILASIADGCIVVNQKGEIVLINRMAQKMLGYTSKESIGRQWHEILHRQDEGGNPILPEKGAIRAALATTTTTATITSYYYLRKDGTRFPVSRTVSPVTSQGKVIGAVNVFRDITREKEIDKIKSEFVSIASHQLRTPLTGIQWLTELLQKEKLTDKGQEYLNDIETSGQRLNKLVELLLNTSRIQAGKVSISPQFVDVVDFTKKLIDGLAPLCRKKRLSFGFASDEKEIIAMTDVGAFQNIAQAIFSNAIEYTPQGGKVGVKIEKQSETFLLTISDNGIGIPQKDQGRMFQEFARASNAGRLKAVGMGLGLWIAKQATELLGGKIWFKSEENKGTTFFIELPLESKPVKGAKQFT
ncbi:MAG: ATP-binding protein [Patescibacteria group bacterium]|nr:ATP-binding protein [Patescibacteria group bacterium]